MDATGVAADATGVAADATGAAGGFLPRSDLDRLLSSEAHRLLWPPLRRRDAREVSSRVADAGE